MHEKMTTPVAPLDIDQPAGADEIPGQMTTDDMTAENGHG